MWDVVISFMLMGFGALAIIFFGAIFVWILCLLQHEE